MEVNYGKHWDEINNKKKLLISQAFKNSSSSSVVSYFMEVIEMIEKYSLHFRYLTDRLRINFEFCLL